MAAVLFVAAALPARLLAAEPGELVYVIRTMAGSDLVGDGGLALAGQIDSAKGIASDRQGNIYVADSGNHRIRKVTRGGLISTVAGSGHPGFSGDGGPAEAAQLSGPVGLAFDAAGNLYVADTENHRVRRISTDGRIQTVIGTGQKGSASPGDPLGTELMTPRDLAFDFAGNLYISEFDGHRVRKLGTDGKVTTVAGTGVAGDKGDYGVAAAAQLNRPAGLAVDRNGALYIIDTENRRLRKVTGGLISPVANLEWSEGMAAVAVDAAGAVYACDRPYLIRRLTDKGWLTVAGTGQPAYNGDGKASKATNLNPTSFVFDAEGNLLVAESRRVRRISGDLVYGVAGDGTFGYHGDDGPASLAHLNGPTGLALDRAGNLYVADTANQRIRRIDSAGGIATIAGNGVFGAGGGAGATQTSLADPEGVALDTAGNLLIADRKNCRVLRLLPGGALEVLASRCKASPGADGDPIKQITLFYPRAVAADASGNVFISDTDHHRILRASPDGTVVSYAGNGSSGYAGDGGAANNAQLSSPAGLAVDPNGGLYVADTNNHRIRKVDSRGIIETVAGTGSQGFGGDGGKAGDAWLNTPSGIALDGERNLYIADTMNQRIRKVGGDGRIWTIAGDGNQGYDGDGGPAASARLFRPAYIVAGPKGTIYFSDSFNDRIRMLELRVVEGDSLQMLSVLNAASLQPGPVAPGELVSIFGGAIGPRTPVEARLNTSGALETALGEVKVLFDGKLSPLLWAGENQINAQVPYSVAGQKITELEVIYRGYSRGTALIGVAGAVPAIFVSPDDPSRGLIVNQDWSINSIFYPAARNSIVTFFATGDGVREPALVEGVPAAQPYPKPQLPVNVRIGGFDAEVLYAGSAPGFVGLMQVNARVPGGFLPSGLLPLTLTVGEASSQPGIHIAVK